MLSGPALLLLSAALPGVRASSLLGSAVQNYICDVINAVSRGNVVQYGW